jgi:hypothetical protein
MPLEGEENEEWKEESRFGRLRETSGDTFSTFDLNSHCQTTAGIKLDEKGTFGRFKWPPRPSPTFIKCRNFHERGGS